MTYDVDDIFAIVARGFTIQTLREFEVLENLSLKLSKRKFVPYSDRLACGNRTDKEHGF